MSGFSGFGFSDADSLFQRFFRNSGFDSKDDQDFFGSFLGRRNRNGQKGSGGLGGFGFSSMFDNDDFFKSGFGKSGGGFGSFGTGFGFD